MSQKKQPNIVLIFTDNQQASTLACYGNSEIHTPNLDRLAQQGMVFDNAFCPNAFCSPCRASVLTGLLPSQHGVHSWIDDRNMAEWPENWHALDGLRTLPGTLQQAGYKTALCGKYHLGEPTSVMDGFDYWCTMADGHVRSFYRNPITENGETYDHNGHTVDLFTQRGIGFMEEQAASDTPFFLYLPYPAPYGHWPATREADRNRFSALYDDCPMTSIPREGLSKEAVEAYLLRHTYSGDGLDYSMILRAPNDLPTLRNYYAQISMVDDGVGQIMDALERLGLAEDTILVFTSDHGMSVGQHGFWGHGAATYPSNMHKAAHSVPLLVRHGPSVGANQRSSTMVSNMDLYSTLLDYAGQPNDQGALNVPSRSLRPLLNGQSGDWGEDAVYSEQEETRVIRTAEFAYFKRFKADGDNPFSDALYDVANDPSETANLISDPAFADVCADLAARIDTFFDAHTLPAADLWKGGTPKQNTERAELWRAAWGRDWAPTYAYDGG
ncbi:MAG: sulfatase-like hydrolase/transferase [Planktotalea sp.]|uniref:sulfatase family protein n=1 Tax=Planktotalea sp. TaxID=2029877 RepID=UPI003C70E794